jgi:hypothetical protein
MPWLCLGWSSGFNMELYGFDAVHSWIDLCETAVGKRSMGVRTKYQ